MHGASGLDVRVDLPAGGADPFSPGADASSPSSIKAEVDVVDGAERTRNWAERRHHFRFIVSPEHGDRIVDLRDYTRHVIGRSAPV